MRAFALAALAIGVWITFPQGKPGKWIVHAGGNVDTQKATESKQNQQSLESSTIQALIREIQIQQQQQTQEFQSQASRANQDVGIQGRLVKYTRALVWVGVLQAFALLLTVFVIYIQVITTRDSERAWILADPGIIPDDFEPDPNRIAFLEARPVIKNYGRTPARITGSA